MAINTQLAQLAASSPNGLAKCWQMVRFDQMAEAITHRVDNPLVAGVERYVGLEHLDPESLKIRRWGSPEDVSATKLLFKPGDIIFGRRRAYQRKLAVADFEGICSAHALVLRAREDTVVKEYLPVFMQSDVFFERALAISVGSLSPTINWKTLASQEFLLPPKEEQRRIANILWAADEAIQQLKTSIQKFRLAKATLVDAMLDELYGESGYSIVPLGAIFTRSPQSGHSVVPATGPTGHYELSLTALGPAGYIPQQFKHVHPGPEIEAARLNKGDLLVSRSNTIELVGLAGIFDEEHNNVSFPDTMMRIYIDTSRLKVKFLETLLLSKRGRVHMRRTAAGTSASMKKINRQSLGKFPVVCPPLTVQEQVLTKVGQFDQQIGALSRHHGTVQVLKSDLVSRLLNPQEQIADVH